MPIAIKTIYIWALKLGAKLELMDGHCVKVIFRTEGGGYDYFVVYLNEGN